MVAIRLARQGTNSKPFFRIVIQDKNWPRNGKILENVGTYDPRKVDSKVILKSDRVKYWLEKGAQPTLTVKDILRTYYKPTV